MAQKLYVKVLAAVGTACGNETVYTDSTNFQHARGYCGALITISNGGSYVITQQCSVDNENWYNPVDDDNTALGLVCTGAHTSTCYKYFSPVLAPFIRFKVVGTVAGGKYGFTLISQEN